MQAQRTPTTTVTVVLEIEVDEHVWANVYGAGDAYDRAEAQQRRSLYADVEDYVHQAVAESAASHEDAFREVNLVPGGEYS